MIKLSKRLETIVSLIPKSIVADVGSDHGKLMISLFERSIIEKGYAIENKKGPYERLCNNLKAYNAIDTVVPLLSDGISELPECVNTVVLAGMGGSLIINILCKHPDKLRNVETIIVDAHSCLSKVRSSIVELGYSIAQECIVKDANKFYEIIKFVKSDKAIYSDADYDFGPILRQEKSTTFKEKYSNRIKEIDNILSNNKDIPTKRVESLNKEKERINKII
mgnify:CR=1 FL=1